MSAGRERAGVGGCFRGTRFGGEIGSICTRMYYRTSTYDFQNDEGILAAFFSKESHFSGEFFQLLAAFFQPKSNCPDSNEFRVLF